MTTARSKPLMNVTEEQVEQVRQDLADCHVASSYLELNPEAVAILLTVCTDWLRISKAMESDSCDNFATHYCNACSNKYTPAVNESEDCPKCGYNGKGN